MDIYFFPEYLLKITHQNRHLFCITQTFTIFTLDNSQIYMVLLVNSEIAALLRFLLIKKYEVLIFFSVTFAIAAGTKEIIH